MEGGNKIKSENKNEIDGIYSAIESDYLFVNRRGIGNSDVISAANFRLKPSEEQHISNLSNKPEFCILNSIHNYCFPNVFSNIFGAALHWIFGNWLSNGTSAYLNIDKKGLEKSIKLKEEAHEKQLLQLRGECLTREENYQRKVAERLDSLFSHEDGVNATSNKIEYNSQFGSCRIEEID